MKAEGSASQYGNGYSAAQAEANGNLYGAGGLAQADQQSRIDQKAVVNQYEQESNQYSNTANQYGASRSPYSSDQILFDQYRQNVHPYSPTGSELKVEGVYQLRQGESPYTLDQTEAKDQYSFRAGQYAATKVQALENSASNQFSQSNQFNSPNAVQTAKFKPVGIQQADASNQQYGSGYPGYRGTLSRFDSTGYDELNNGYEAVSVPKQGNNLLYPAVPASSLYPKLYSRPSSHVTPLYVPPGFRDGGAENSDVGQGSQVNAGGELCILICFFKSKERNAAGNGKFLTRTQESKVRAMI